MPGDAGNQPSGAEALVRLLEGYGVRHLFGLCGDTSLPLYDALYRLDHNITHVLTRDERSAAYMADCYARVTGRAGVCEGPSGGGATYILPGVVEANESSVPVLAITTDIATTSRGRFALTELDQEALFRPLTKWNRVIDRADRLPASVRSAFRAMTTGRPGAAHLGLPFDVQKAPVVPDDVWAEPAYGRFPAHPAAPDARDVEAAADVLRQARRPLILCGGGPVMVGAKAEVAAMAERLQAPVATSISGKGAIAETHPLALGVVGSNGGTPENRALIDAADAILVVGCRLGSVTTERWRHPAPGRARIVQIDTDPGAIGANYATSAALIGDARAALRSLLAVLADVHPARPGIVREVAEANRTKFARFDRLAASEEVPIRPERVIAALQALLPEDAILVADPGTPCPYVSAYYRQPRAGRHVISNRAHGALGYALAAAAGAKFGRPDAQVVAIMGDGSFGFTCGELETLARLDLPLTLIVLANASYGWIKAGQRAGFGERYFSVDFSTSNHARIAEAFGVRAWRVEQPGALAPTLERALAHDGPALVDIVTQPLHQAAAPVSEWVA